MAKSAVFAAAARVAHGSVRSGRRAHDKSARRTEGVPDDSTKIHLALLGSRSRRDDPGEAFDGCAGGLAPDDPQPERRGVGLTSVSRRECRLAAIAQAGMRVMPGRMKRLAPDERVDHDHTRVLPPANRRRESPLPGPAYYAKHNGEPHPIREIAGPRVERAPFVAASRGLWDCAARSGRAGPLARLPPRRGATLSAKE